ncbi:hypothetical protein SESBI_08279 [Sesbania bispinosa]|nr:hypothetical protein SESBI_08279 [Sesbania bispinosa]
MLCKCGRGLAVDVNHGCKPREDVLEVSQMERKVVLAATSFDGARKKFKMLEIMKCINAMNWRLRTWN